MTFITFENDVDWSPTFSISGGISPKVYRIISPELSGDFTISGTISVLIPRPRGIVPLAGQFTIWGNLSASIRNPNAAFGDFSHYPFAGVDPAMAYIGATNAGLPSAAAGAYARQNAVFAGPQDYPVSGTGYAWKRAAYTAVGFKFAGMLATKDQLLSAVQLEAAPIGLTVPTPFVSARSLQVVVKPTRLNYATNPNFESGLAGYYPVSPGTLALDTFCWTGSQALKVTVPAGTLTNAGVSFDVNGLIPGRQYAMSARVALATGCGDIAPWAVSSHTPQINQVTYKNAADGADPHNPRWRVVSVTFTATLSTVALGFTVIPATMAPATPSIFWVDGVLPEEGASPRPYFDGSYGEDYLWETGGTANRARSYFYENRVERGYLVQTLLSENIPLGTTSAVPQYAVLPTQ